MKTTTGRLAKLLALMLVAVLVPVYPVFSQSGPPPFPPYPILDIYKFADTNWLSVFGDAPLDFTNVLCVPEWAGNAALIDTTNSIPAFLAYNIVETNGDTNIDFSTGALKCVFICDWATADTNQNGSGPGDWSFLIAAGDFSDGSSNGLWAVYFDPGGTNIYFGGLSNSTSTIFVSAPISWPSNSVHLIGISYLTNTMLYIDGQLVATGDPVTIVPATNVWTNGFFVGSDSSGYEQARGAFKYLELDNSNLFEFYGSSYFTNGWANISNQFAAWVGGGGSPDFAPGSPGFLLPEGGSGDCVTGTNLYYVYMTNTSFAVVSGEGNTFTFTVSGGVPDVAYDVFSTTNLSGAISNANWTWLGEVTNCGIYTVTNQPSIQTFYLLGTPLTNDESGLTVAYKHLISTNAIADAYGTPTAWYLWHGLSPQLLGSGIGGDDSDGDGLLNYQEYLYGTNPQISEGFTVWVSEPGTTSSIP